MHRHCTWTNLNVGAERTRKTLPVTEENLTYSNILRRSRSKKHVPSKLSHSMATAASPSNLTRNACCCDGNNAVTCRLSKEKRVKTSNKLNTYPNAHQIKTGSEVVGTWTRWQLVPVHHNDQKHSGSAIKGSQADGCRACYCVVDHHDG